MRTVSFKKILFGGFLSTLFSLSSAMGQIPSSLDSIASHTMYNTSVDSCTTEVPGGQLNIGTCQETGFEQGRYSALIENMNTQFGGIQCTPAFLVDRANYIHVLVAEVSKAFVNDFIDPTNGSPMRSFLRQALHCGIAKMEGDTVTNIEAKMHLPEYRLMLSYVGRGLLKTALHQFPICTLDNINNWYQFVHNNQSMVDGLLEWGDGSWTIAGQPTPFVGNFNLVVADHIVGPQLDSCCNDGSFDVLTHSAICP